MTNPAAPRVNAKFVFWSLVVVAVLVMLVAFSFLLILADHHWFGGTRRLGGYGGTLAVPAFLVAFGFATAVCRRLGLVEPPQVELLRAEEGRQDDADNTK